MPPAAAPTKLRSDPSAVCVKSPVIRAGLGAATSYEAATISVPAFRNAPSTVPANEVLPGFWFT